VSGMMHPATILGRSDLDDSKPRLEKDSSVLERTVRDHLLLPDQ